MFRSYDHLQAEIRNNARIMFLENMRSRAHILVDSLFLSRRMRPKSLMPQWLTGEQHERAWTAKVTNNSLRGSWLLYDWRSVSQYVLVSSSLVGLATRYYFLSECCCVKFAVLFLWGALSDERTGLQFAMQSLNGPSRAEPITTLYCLIWDSPTWRARFPYSYPPGTRWPSYTPGHWVLSIWTAVLSSV
jgi:hypothetical protein